MEATRNDFVASPEWAAPTVGKSSLSVGSVARSLRVAITRRHLQIALGVLWVLDGALQLQPFMFTTGFANQIISPTGDGQPRVVAGPVHWGASLIAAHPLPWGVAFAAVQLGIGLALFVPRAARLALGASIAWALGVWYFGEGLSGLASGHASLLAGAPGSVLLYGLLAIAAWPRRGRSDVAPARWLPRAWAAIWIGGAIFQALPGQNTGTAIAGLIPSGGGPGWLNRLDASVSGWIGGHGVFVVVALVTVELLIGIGALYRRSLPVAAAAGFVLALAIWVVGQSFGLLYTGQATDPNTAPLIALMAVVLLADTSVFAKGIRLPRLQPNAAFERSPVPAMSGASMITRPLTGSRFSEHSAVKQTG
jgi:hypothetical protein